MLNCFFNFLILLLHRPFYQPHLRSDIPINDLAAKRCERSACVPTNLIGIVEESDMSPDVEPGSSSCSRYHPCWDASI